MPTATLGLYSPALVQNLPTLKVAREAYLKAGGDALIDQLKDFFVRAGMDTKFGLSMLHRHFDIPVDQKLVEYNGTSTLWRAVPGMDDLKPHMWAYDQDGMLKPTEFRYTKQADDVAFGREELKFIAELEGLLEELGLSSLFGLARYPGDDFPGSCEITQGMTNINLQPEDYPEDLVQIPTIWWLSESLYRRGCRCTCNASAADHPHGAHAITISG